MRTIIVILFAAVVCPGLSFAAAVPVKVKDEGDGRFTLLRDGRPYSIRGAGGWSRLNMLKECGGNSVRTWGVAMLESKVDGKRLIDRCDELGLTVTAGIWVEHERHGFDYSNAEQIRKQREKVRAAVRKYKDHPALLLWGLGNEMELQADKGKGTAHVWKELNELAAIIKQEDPNHPVMTVIAGAAKEKIKGILEHYPNLDILGVNAYRGAIGCAAALKAAGWKKPFVVTEFGPPGHWEVSKTKWGAPIEPSSRDKATSYSAAQTALTEKAANFCLGSYCFLWGQKQEVTSTWYGMFLKTGEKLPPVDAMCKAWTGKVPAKQCPRVKSVESELKEAVFPPGKRCVVKAEATDPEGAPLTWEWSVVAESTDRKRGGDKESEPPSFPECVISMEKDQAVIQTPAEAGNYRVFVIVRNGRGAASVENICFRVEKR